MVVDSSALVAILRQEADRIELRDKIARSTQRLVSTVSLLETAIVLASGDKDASAWEDLDAFLQAMRFEIVPFGCDQQLAAREGFLKFGRGRHSAGLNFGDCAAYALAKTRNLPLLFKGNDFAKTDVLVA